MNRFPIAGLVVFLVLGACTRSDRTITLEESRIDVMPHYFQSGFAAILYSADGQLAAGYLEGGQAVVVREVSTGVLIGRFTGLENDWHPLLFTSDNRAVVMIAETSEGVKTAVVPVTGSDRYPATHSRIVVVESSADGDDSSFGAVNYDSTMFALSGGVVVFQDGSLILATGAAGGPFFDQFGTVWYRTSEGWTSVDRGMTVTEGIERPSYLVQNQTVHRGSMHLLQDEVTIERNDAEAYITAVWLDHDKGIMVEDGNSDELVQDRTALVYAGADVLSFVFVPNRKLVAIVTHDGTAFVPYVVEARGKEEE